MSDDDGLREGAIARVLALLRPGTFSFIAVNASICNDDVSQVLTPRFVDIATDRTYERGEDERLFVDTGNYLTFIARLERAIAEQAAEVATAQACIDKEKEHWREQERERRTFETLLDRRRIEGQRLEARSQQKQLDEFATRTATQRSTG